MQTLQEILLQVKLEEEVLMLPETEKQTQENTILVVDDDPTTHILVYQALKKYYVIERALSLQEAREKIKSKFYDLLLLDLRLPDGEGFDLFKDFPDLAPVIILSLKSEVETKLQGFELGAYDYIAKPFDQRELLARVRAHLLRASTNSANKQRNIEMGDLLLNQDAKQVFLKSGLRQEPVALSPTEYKVLRFFMLNPGKVFARDQLAFSVWNKRYFASRTIDRHISTLREKLKHCSNYIQTVHQTGYRFYVAKNGH